jgi:hypothetical protein
MQPYLLPYIGYFQLITAVDAFVLYDNIQYTKRGWINRNRFLRNGGAETFTLPLAAGSDFLTIRERRIADTFNSTKLLNQFHGAYRQAPFYDSTRPLLNRIFALERRDLFGFLRDSLAITLEHLSIPHRLITSSTIAADHELKGEERVVEICHAIHATHYLNPIGGIELYSKDSFASAGIKLSFLRTKDLNYEQFGGLFVPNLSIIDVLMFNSITDTKRLIETHWQSI